MAKSKRDISVLYESIDRFCQRRKFKTVKGASKFARKWVGDHPEQGSYYAVSFDGVGKVSWSGATFDELFPRPEPAKSDDYGFGDYPYCPEPPEVDFPSDLPQWVGPPIDEYPLPF